MFPGMDAGSFKKLSGFTGDESFNSARQIARIQ